MVLGELFNSDIILRSGHINDFYEIFFFFLETMWDYIRQTIPSTKEIKSMFVHLLLFIAAIYSLCRPASLQFKLIIATKTPYHLICYFYFNFMLYISQFSG